ncbi:MAG: tRNA pseudouridine synthase A [Gemmatimonadota bacterium]|nr:tRNA pseudouridine synthase A [Gemmatimonadota bacterium]
MSEAPGGDRFRATIEYDGVRFAGWQVQPDARTVQGEIEAVLSRLFDAPTRIVGAGRTDTGVHATAQEIRFTAPSAWDPSRLRRALQALLPEDVRAVTVERAAPGFHPRFSATGRRYEYFVAPGPDGASPLRSGRVWAPGRSPDPATLEALAPTLLGRGDFRALSRRRPEGGTECTVERAVWLPTPAGDLRFVIVADRFLHRMVRYLVATMVEVAIGRRGAGDLAVLRAGAPGARPPRPAPASGLYLTGVRYATGWNRGPGVPGLWPLRARQAADPRSGDGP